MRELSLADQDVEILTQSLELLLLRIKDREDLVLMKAPIKALLARVRSMSGDERLQTTAAIATVLTEMSTELELSKSNT
jgi:hypothetical protein